MIGALNEQQYRPTLIQVVGGAAGRAELPTMPYSACARSLRDYVSEADRAAF